MRCRALIQCLWILLLPGVSMCRQPGEVADAVEAAANPKTGSVDGIAETIRFRDAVFSGWLLEAFTPGGAVHDFHLARKDLARRLCLNVALSYDALLLGGLNDAADWGAASGETALSVRWQINADGSPRPLSLATRLRYRDAWGHRAPSELRAATGAIWGYVDGFSDAGAELPEIYLEQHFFKDRLLLRYGHMAIDDLLDNHRMRSAKRSFLNQAFSSSPAVGFPGAGIGAVASWTGDHGWDLTLAASNLESSNREDASRWSFDTGSFFGALQAGRRFPGICAEPARLQVLAWNADAVPDLGLDSGTGASLTFEQSFPRRLSSYLRYAWSDGEAAPAAQMIALGLSKGLTDGSRAGLALAAGRASDGTGRWQSVLECFYRKQVGPLLISPDIQLNLGDDLADGRGWLLLAGLRVGMTF